MRARASSRPAVDLAAAYMRAPATSRPFTDAPPLPIGADGSIVLLRPRYAYVDSDDTCSESSSASSEPSSEPELALSAAFAEKARGEA